MKTCTGHKFIYLLREINWDLAGFRSSSLGVFCKTGILENSTKFTGKYLCQSLFFNRVAALRPATLLKKRLTQVFSCEICEIFKSTFFYRTSRVAASVV